MIVLSYRPAKQDDFDYFLAQDPAFSNPHCIGNLSEHVGIERTQLPSLMEQLHKSVICSCMSGDHVLHQCQLP